jgi:hypothetical protein
LFNQGLGFCCVAADAVFSTWSRAIESPWAGFLAGLPHILYKGLHALEESALRDCAGGNAAHRNRLLVRNFNLPFFPQSATLFVRAGKLPSRTDGPEKRPICRDLFIGRHNERAMPHHLAASQYRMVWATLAVHISCL